MRNEDTAIADARLDEVTADTPAGESSEERAARALASALSPSACIRNFDMWQRHGLHVTPVHYYFPIPDTRTLPETLWKKESSLPGIDMNDALQLDLLRVAFPAFKDEYNAFPHDETADPCEFYYNNPMFGGTDALALYCMVRHYRPRLVLEVGCGFSSRVTAKAALRNGDTSLVCIEPYPDEVLKAGFPGLVELIPKKVQDVDPACFQRLQSGDILFIDSSHVATTGSDVTYLFGEVIPRLNPGVLIHVHDIFFPREYRRDWVIEQKRFWNEQYLLQAFLAFNAEFDVLLCNSYLEAKYKTDLVATFPNSPWWGGGSFWMRRKPDR